jgi:hypothetical protein
MWVTFFELRPMTIISSREYLCPQTPKSVRCGFFVIFRQLVFSFKQSVHDKKSDNSQNGVPSPEFGLITTKKILKHDHNNYRINDLP